MPHDSPESIRARLATIDASPVIAIAQRLIATPSPNPPGDTSVVAQVAADILCNAIPDIDLALHEPTPGIVNLVARLRGHAPGRRIVLNGHLDTYPVNEALPWTVDPLGGELRDGKLYGRGAADMKGGIAASIAALAALAENRTYWQGEVVLTLAGDEESMGDQGTAWLLANVPHARGDAVIIGDAGAPDVLRFGEKGFLWLHLHAGGKAAHGAHVHLGINAVDRLRRALDALAALTRLPFTAPAGVVAAIAAAKPVSEPLCGAGEAEVLGAITVNVGRIEGGTSMNLVPAAAEAWVDIRLPAGTSTARLETAIAEALAPIAGVSCDVLRRVEPSVTAPDAEIVTLALAAARSVMGHAPVANMRVGGSDSRLFRKAGIPTIVYGPTPFNMGGADEYVQVAELATVARVHALTSFEFLRS